MGYTTDFSGIIKINKVLDRDTRDLLVGLATTRRMKRDPQRLAERLGITFEEVVEQYGVDCEFYYPLNSHNYGQENTDDIIDFNRPPSTQPGLWLQWVPTSNNQAIEWDEAEKFYEAPLWMKYIIDKILAPRGYVLNGTVEAQGESPSDRWRLVVRDNKVLTADAVVLFRDPVPIDV